MPNRFDAEHVLNNPDGPYSEAHKRLAVWAAQEVFCRQAKSAAQKLRDPDKIRQQQRASYARCRARRMKETPGA